MQAEEVEATLRALLARQERDALLSTLVEAYGAELLGFIAVLVHDEEEAREVFAGVCESIVRGLGTFEGRASFRTWAYAIARNAASNHRRKRAPVRLDTAQAERIPVEVRPSTRPYLKTENKALLARLRAALDPDAQALLTLRIDRAMAWDDIAQVLSEEPLDDAARKRASARCRKRFDRIKERLRRAAEEGRED